MIPVDVGSLLSFPGRTLLARGGPGGLEGPVGPSHELPYFSSPATKVLTLRTLHRLRGGDLHTFIFDVRVGGPLPFLLTQGVKVEVNHNLRACPESNFLSMAPIFGQTFGSDLLCRGRDEWHDGHQPLEFEVPTECLQQ